MVRNCVRVIVTVGVSVTVMVRVIVTVRVSVTVMVRVNKVLGLG